eukprot:1147195-Pelagomonas_calceolata.AAC.3
MHASLPEPRKSACLHRAHQCACPMQISLPASCTSVCLPRANQPVCIMRISLPAPATAHGSYLSISCCLERKLPLSSSSSSSSSSTKLLPLPPISFPLSHTQPTSKHPTTDLSWPLSLNLYAAHTGCLQAATAARVQAARKCRRQRQPGTTTWADNKSPPCSADALFGPRAAADAVLGRHI